MPDDPQRLGRLARYLTRAPVRIDAAEQDEAGQIRIATPPDPMTGATERVMDPLEWIHALTNQIPGRGRHTVRYYGAYSSRIRGLRRKKAQASQGRPDTTPDEGLAFSRTRKASWARLLRKAPGS